MKRFSDYFYEAFADRVNGKIIYDGEKNVEVTTQDGDRMVKFYGTRKMVVKNRFVVKNFTKHSMQYLVSRAKH